MKLHGKGGFDVLKIQKKKSKKKSRLGALFLQVKKPVIYSPILLFTAGRYPPYGLICHMQFTIAAPHHALHR
jgi:hypothetical protein